MQKIKKEVKTETEVFVAEDGKEFSTERECKNYERALRLKRLLDEVNQIERSDVDMPPMGYEYTDVERYSYVWFKPKTKREIEALNEYFIGGLTAIDIGVDEIGKWVGIEFEGGPDIEDYDGDAYSLELEPSFQKTVDFYTALGYSVEIRDSKGEVVASSKDNSGVGDNDNGGD